MANADSLKIDVSIAEMKIPLLILVGDEGQVKVYENGVETRLIKTIRFTAGIDEVATLEINKLVRKP